MRLEFSNKKDRKHCQGFIKALKQVEKYHAKNPTRPLYLTLNHTELRLAPFLTDIQYQDLQSSCVVIFNIQNISYQVEEGQIDKVYLIETFKMIKAFKKNESKIVQIELNIGKEGMLMTFETENKMLVCQVKVPCEQVKQKWPQKFQKIGGNSELIPVAKLGEKELKTLTLESCKEALWVEISQLGLIFRVLQKGKYRRESKFFIGNDSGFNYNSLKSKLRNKVFFSMKGQDFLSQLHQMSKRKRTGQLSIKVINDSYAPAMIRRSFLLFNISTEFGAVQSIVQCYMCQEIGEQALENLREERAYMRETQVKSTLLKKEDVIEETKRVMMNIFSDPMAARKNIEDAYRERHMFGKIEDNENTVTVTRKFESRY